MKIIFVRNYKRMAIIFFFMFLFFLVIPDQGMATSQEVLEGAKKEGNLMFYFSLPPEEGKALLAAFCEKYPFINTDFYRSPAQRLDEKFKAEVRAGKIIPDVLYTGLDTPCFDWKRMGLLVPYRSPEYAYLYKDAIEPDGYWAAWKYITIGIVVNSKVLPKNLWPSDWTDYINPKPEWKDLLIVPDPTVSSSAYIWLYGMKQRYGFGTAKKIVEGLKKANSSVMLAYADGMTKASTGEKAIVVNMMLEWLVNYKKTGAPLEYIIPKSGIIRTRAVGGLVNKAPHPNAGKLFIDFACSEEGQALLAQKIKNYPSRPDVGLPPDIPEFVPFDKINVISVDELAGSKEISQMIEMWKKVMER